MKILIATGMYPPTIGGPATYAKLLNDELPERNISVKVLSFEKFLKYPKFISQGLYFLKLLSSASDIDIIYALDPVTVGFPAMVASKILGKKFVVRIAGDRAWEQGVQQFDVKEILDEFVKDRIEYHPKVMQIKSIQKQVAKSAGKIIVPSRYLKKIVSQWSPEIDEDKISVIYNSFEPKNVPYQDTEKKRTIISAGRLVPWKGFGTLISLMPNLLNEFPDLKLIIAGDGPERKKLEELISGIGLEDKVRLTGSLSKEDLYGAIRSSDLFILNTAYEGFSHQLLEVMYIGTPIITTNVGGNPEIIENEKNGLLVEYNEGDQLEETIKKLLKDRVFAHELSESAKGTVSKFNKERMLEELITELESVL